MKSNRMDKHGYLYEYDSKQNIYILYVLYDI